MEVKAILFSCALALMAQSAFGACAAGLGRLGRVGARNGGFGAGLGCGRGGYGAGYYGSYGGYGGYGGYGAGFGGYGGYGAGFGGCGWGRVASTGGGLHVASASCNAPIGISLRSENAYEGTLCAGGNLPFLGTVGIEGVLPTAGAGAVSYGCGNGAVGIANEGCIGSYGAGTAGYGRGGCGCGCGSRF